MKRVIAFIILYSFLWILWTFVFLCPSTKAQWEGAQVQRLTYNNSANSLEGLYIDENDKLFLFYHQWKWDPEVQPYRDSMFVMTKEKDGEWSQPEKIGNPSFEVVGYGRYLGYDATTGVIHMVYSSTPGDLYDDTLYYTNSNVPDWEVVKIDSLPGAQWHARYRSLNMDFDSLGNVHLVWNLKFDSLGANWYRIMYANNSTGAWIKQQVSPPIWLGGSGGSPAQFDVQKNGTAHIVYHGEPYCHWECQAFYTRNDSLNSTNWVTDTVPKPSRPLWGYSAGPIKVHVDDRVHLITGGCTVEYCAANSPEEWRTFYYYKQAEDSIWQGSEQIPDTMFGFMYIPQLLVDKQGVPYMGCQTTSNEAYFTDRKQGSWQVPYYLVGWHTTSASDSFMVDNFSFVLDSQGKGHGAFSAFNFAQGMLEHDSVEIYYLSSSNSGVDTEEDYKVFHFNLFQNYPNPFNSVTSIQYTVSSRQNHPIHTTLKIYNILGKEVRELVNTKQSSGNYTIIWDGKNNKGKEVSSGIYFYQLTVRQAHRPEQSRGRAGNFTETKKLVLIK